MNHIPAMARPRILFSSPTRPLGPRTGDAFSCRANAAFQLTWAQDGFRAEDTMHHWGLDLMAANIEAPATVLHYPSLAQFEREVRKQYDWVGLTFNLCTFHKIKPMVRAVRRLAPCSRIVLGGYGTVLDDATLGPWADAICREEGIAFMRRLLGEDPQPFVHPHVAIERRLFSMATGERTGIVLASVGCPHGCEFCITSHFFHRKPIHFVESGEQLFAIMRSMRERDPGISSFAIMDEDFLGHRRRAMELLRCVRDASVFLDLMVFSSVQSISRYDPIELAEMGISRIWIGYEARNAGYDKLEGKPFGQLVASLRKLGISVVVSMIVGYDHQTPDMIRDELREVMAVRPTATQIMLFSPCPGTPAWDRLSGEGRLDADLTANYRLHDGYTLLFRHPTMSRVELESLVRELYDCDYRTLGPSPLRFLETTLAGYRNGNGVCPRLRRAREVVFEKRLRRGAALFPLGRCFGPDPDAQAARLRSELECVVGRSGAQRALGYALIPLFLWSRFRYRRGWFEQPRFTRRVYA